MTSPVQARRANTKQLRKTAAMLFAAAIGFGLFGVVHWFAVVMAFAAAGFGMHTLIVAARTGPVLAIAEYRRRGRDGSRDVGVRRLDSKTEGQDPSSRASMMSRDCDMHLVEGISDSNVTKRAIDYLGVFGDIRRQIFLWTRIRPGSEMAPSAEGRSALQSAFALASAR